MSQTDLKYVIGYSSVSHMGYVLLGFAMARRVRPRRGAVFQMFAHGIMTALFFALIGYVYEKTHTRQIAEIIRADAPHAARRRRASSSRRRRAWACPRRAASSPSCSSTSASSCRVAAARGRRVRRRGRDRRLPAAHAQPASCSASRPRRSRPSATRRRCASRRWAILAGTIMVVGIYPASHVQRPSPRRHAARSTKLAGG